MMSIRSFFGGFFVIAGCSTAVLVVAILIMSMQLDTGTGLLFGVLALVGAALSLVLGFFVLTYRT